MSKSRPKFSAGDEIEVICQDEGFKGALYEARIVRSMPKLKRYLIEYETLMDDRNPTKNLRETVAVAQVRPRPKPVKKSRFEIGEKVDAFHNDGWWSGEIWKVVDEGKRYVVRFHNGDEEDGGEDEEVEYGVEEIRVHMDWVNEKWILPRVRSKV